MNLWQNYLQPNTLSEALKAFSTAPQPLVIVAGGTDILIDLQQGRHEPVKTLVDISRVVEMHTLELRGEYFFIGAGASVNKVALDPLTFQHARALVDACNLIAGPQVRNVATLGGNVAHGLPAADGTIALLALDAQVEIASVTGFWKIPLRDIFLGPGKTAIKHGEELLVGFYLPISRDHQSSGFKRIMRPQGIALPILNCAVWLDRSQDIVKDIRIAVGPGGPTPFRATQTESFLKGKSLSDSIVELAGDTLIHEAHFRTSARRASQEYRMHLALKLFKDTTFSAWERAK